MTVKVNVEQLSDSDDIEVESNQSKANETPSNAHNHRVCCIGLDKATGRVKWCPDCEYVKYLIIIPLILLPITIALILIVQINAYDGGIDFEMAAEIARNDTAMYEQQEQLNEPHHYRRDYRHVKDDNNQQLHENCKLSQSILSEIQDIHEKEFFRDIRTSFIPTDSFSLPVNCLRHRINNKTINDKLSDTTIYGVINDQTIQANQLNDDQLSSSSSYWLSKFVPPFNGNSIERDSTQKMSSLLLRMRRQLNKISGKSNEQTANDNNNDNDDATLHNIPPLLKTFWKCGKTHDRIRQSQVDIMKQYIDETAEPCNDFYQYACGNWEKLNPIPKDKSAYDTFEMLREILDIELNILLSENANETKILFRVADVGNSIDGKPEDASMPQKRSTTDNPVIVSAEQKAKYLYASCMNSANLEKRGIEPLEKLLKSLGGWPVLEGDKWKENEFNWLELAGKLRLYNNDIFLMQWVGPDLKNSEENVIQFDQISLGLPSRDYFLQESNAAYLKAYKEYVTQVMILCGADVLISRKTADEILEFEKKLASIMASPEERVNVTQIYLRMNVALLQHTVPQINWKQYLEIVLERKIQNNETIIMFAMPFMKNLVKLLNNTESKVIANYMFWKFIRHRINSLDDRFLEAKQQFYNVLIGREKSPPRWKICVNQVNSNMGMAVGAMFVRKYFDEKSKQDTMAMTHELQESFRIILNETDWLDEPTRILAEQKINSMSLKIGYPDYILNKKELDEKYKDLDINPDRYFENILNVLKHLARTDHRKLSQTVNRTSWNTAPAVVNAYYSRNKNQIMFPAGILQPPFYHRYLPRSLNFGGIGVVIGHELTHGFDDKGRLFDREGNMNRWWTETAIESFHQRANCLIAQYGNYRMTEIDDQAVDGTITQGENIADNGGIKQAFRAYEKWLDEHCRTQECLQEEHLDGLNATHKQLFFINFAQVWCGAMRPEATKNKMKTAVHSPGRFRVIGEYLKCTNTSDFPKS